TILLDQNPSHARRTWLLGLQKGLADGQSVAEAVQTHNAPFSDGLEVTLISAGERSGRLADGFTHLARYFEAWELGLRQMRSALIYPLVLAHLGLVLPELPAIVTANMNGTEDSPARRLIITVLVFWLVLALLAVGWRWLSRKGTQSAQVERWLWRIPLVGGVRRHWALARFCQVFHACLLAGMRMTECMLLSGEASHSGVLRLASEDAAKKIAAGELIAGAMADVHGFPMVFVHSVATAEEAGTLDREMNSWAAAEMIEAQDALQRATAWLPKVFYAFVVVYVVYRILSMVAGYYGEIGRQLENL
ncbi:MAG: type II secretion system F family protein, partial [Verrucomicrobiaceae bacterium]|nr:type II secretion system F family protein [Verrucomicrobiaceae bacterium]